LGTWRRIANAILVSASGVFRKTNRNDFPAGTVFNAIRVDGDVYTLGGNAATLTGGIGNRGVGNHDRLPVTLAANQGFSDGSLATLTFNAGVSLGGFSLMLDSENSAADALLMTAAHRRPREHPKAGSGLRGLRPPPTASWVPSRRRLANWSWTAKTCTPARQRSAAMPPSRWAIRRALGGGRHQRDRR
jgi:hypothetical protein